MFLTLQAEAMATSPEAAITFLTMLQATIVNLRPRQGPAVTAVPTTVALQIAATVVHPEVTIPVLGATAIVPLAVTAAVHPEVTVLVQAVAAAAIAVELAEVAADIAVAATAAADLLLAEPADPVVAEEDANSYTFRRKPYYQVDYE